MAKTSKLFLCICVLFVLQNAHANNISVTNVGLAGKDISAGTNNPANFAFVKFNISWENSWRTSSAPNNWDAAWVFVKYRIGTGEWKHATLHTTAHSAPAGSTISASADGKGAFIYRTADGTGTANYTNVKLRWDYAADGVLDADQVTVKVLAVEMAYVRQENFSVGTLGPESGSFTNGSWRTGNTLTLQITSENAIVIDTLAGALWGTSSAGDNTIGPRGTLPAGFPKGYNAFYCMKYSISQGQYADFLNTLTYTQQGSRTAVAPNSAAGTKALFVSPQIGDRNGIEIQTAGTESSIPAVYACDLTDDGNYNQNDDGRWIECNWLSWADGAAYSDWAGLRPMSELEFEKACRGPLTPVNNEYIWDGGSAIGPAGITNGGLFSEVAVPDSANSNYTIPDSIGNVGPLRAGNFARATSTRQQSGAAYYGIMDMGGGVWERAVSVGDTLGRLFTGSHGDGTLDGTGNASGVADWPGTNAAGAGFRGGVWDSAPLYLQIANRFVAAFTSADRGGNANMRGTRGFRSVRTAQ